MASLAVPPHVENDAEDVGVDEKHEDGVEDGPKKSQDGTAKPLLDGAIGELAEQLPLAPGLLGDSQWIQRDGIM